MIRFEIPGEPLAFARAGRNGKFSFTPAPQRSFMGMIKAAASQEMQGRAPMEGALTMRIVATYLVPPSWSKKRKVAAKWKTSKPDADNLSKIVKDALSKVVYVDDAQVAVLSVAKMYGPVASLLVTVKDAV